MRRLLPLILVLAFPARADWPAGEPIPGAVLADVTPEGFDAIEGIVPGFVPPSIAIPNPGLYDIEEVCLFGGCLTIYEYGVDIYYGNVGLAVKNVQLTPRSGTPNGYLEFTAVATAAVNSAAAPAIIDIVAVAVEIIDVSGDCDLYVDPITVQISGDVGLALESDPLTGETILNAELPTPTFANGGLVWDFTGDKIHITNCTAGDIVDGIDSVLGFFGVSIYDLVVDPVQGIIEDQVNALVPDLETTIEDSFSSASLSTEVPLGEATLSVDIYPDDLLITDDGVRVSVTGAISATPSPCVAEYAITESKETDEAEPPQGWQPSGLGYAPHISIFADDDLINQGLFAAWSGGLLCYEVVDDGTLPIPVDTSLLGLIAPGVFAELFPEDEVAPLGIITRPRKPPTASPQGAHDINLEVRDLGLDFYSVIDGREMRLMGMDLETDAGIDLNFDGNAGTLAVDIAFDPAEVSGKVTVNEFVPESSGAIEAGFSGILENVVGGIIGGLISDISFPLPSVSGLGLTALEIAPSGPGLDRIGAFATAGTVTYSSEGGCGCGGDTGTTSCEGGCASGGLSPRLGIFAFPLLLALLRRRR